MDKERQEQIMREMYEDGKTYKEIGEAIGLSAEQVRGRIRNRDYYMPGGYKQDMQNETLEKIREELNELNKEEENNSEEKVVVFDSLDDLIEAICRSENKEEDSDECEGCDDELDPEEFDSLEELIESICTSEGIDRDNIEYYIDYCDDCEEDFYDDDDYDCYDDEEDNLLEEIEENLKSLLDKDKTDDTEDTKKKVYSLEECKKIVEEKIKENKREQEIYERFGIDLSEDFDEDGNYREHDYEYDDEDDDDYDDEDDDHWGDLDYDFAFNLRNLEEVVDTLRCIDFDFDDLDKESLDYLKEQSKSIFYLEEMVTNTLAVIMYNWAKVLEEEDYTLEKMENLRRVVLGVDYLREQVEDMRW